MGEIETPYEWKSSERGSMFLTIKTCIAHWKPSCKLNCDVNGLNSSIVMNRDNAAIKV